MMVACRANVVEGAGAGGWRIGWDLASVCAVVSAYFPVTSGDVPSSFDNSTNSTAEAAAIQTALGGCTSGQAVELAVSGSNNGLVINPITIPAGISLIVDGGVTVFGTREPDKYQASGTTQVCGVLGTTNGGCVGLITFDGNNSGIYGYGIISGRAGDTITQGANTGHNWWYLTATQGTSVPNNPGLIVVPNGNNAILYKITLRDSAWYNIQWKGNGLTVWGVKIQGPWNIGDTDGMDIWGTNATVNYTTISNGDDQVAIDGNLAAAGNVTIENVTGYGRDGITIGSSTESGVTNILVENTNLTADAASVSGTTVNGMSQATMESTYGLTSYLQALPTTTNKTVGLNIKTRADRGGTISNVTYSDICMKDLNFPIYLGNFNDPTGGSLYPTVSNITYHNVHGLPHVTPNNAYQIIFEGYPPSQPTPNGITLDNVVFDDVSAGKSSIQILTAWDNLFTTTTNVYPIAFNNLAAAYVASPVGTGTYPTITISDNSYVSQTTSTSASLAYACPTNPFPFTVGELYLTTGTGTGSNNNLRSVTVVSGTSVTLNAMLQPAMSQTTFFAPNGFGKTPGILSIGSPAMTASVSFYEGSTLVGTGAITGNGTLASVTLTGITTGTHTYTAKYPGDTVYGQLTFGSVTVTVD